MHGKVKALFISLWQVCYTEMKNLLGYLQSYFLFCHDMYLTAAMEKQSATLFAVFGVSEKRPVRVFQATNPAVQTVPRVEVLLCSNQPPISVFKKPQLRSWLHTDSHISRPAL